MLVAVIGAIIGVVIGFAFPVYIPAQYSQYVAVGILAALDSVVGGMAAETEKKFSLKIFISGFLMNVLLAGLLTYLGVMLDLDLYLAAVVTFGMRVFQNFAKTRRSLLKLPLKKDTIE